MKRVLIGYQDQINRPKAIRDELAEHARATLALCFEDVDFFVTVSTKPGYFAHSGNITDLQRNRILAAMERIAPRVTTMEIDEDDTHLLAGMDPEGRGDASQDP